MNLLDEFQKVQQENSSVTTEWLDTLANEYTSAWKEHEAAKGIESELRKAAEEVESRLILALEQAGKKKYYVEGLGTFSFTERASVQTPKTIEDKQSLAKYLEESGGKSLFWSTFGVNSNTLQAFYKAEYEAYKQMAEAKTARGEESEPFQIPGLLPPAISKSLRVTKER